MLHSRLWSGTKRAQFFSKYMLLLRKPQTDGVICCPEQELTAFPQQGVLVSSATNPFL